jgi:hypothetical protein
MTQASIQRALISAWLLFAATAILVCWFLGLVDMGRAQGGGEGWGGLFAVMTTIPTVGGVIWGVRVLKQSQSKSWMGFALTFSGILLTSALSLPAAVLLIEHELSLARHAGR